MLSWLFSRAEQAEAGTTGYQQGQKTEKLRKAVKFAKKADLEQVFEIDTSVSLSGQPTGGESSVSHELPAQRSEKHPRKVSSLMERLVPQTEGKSSSRKMFAEAQGGVAPKSANSITITLTLYNENGTSTSFSRSSTVIPKAVAIWVSDRSQHEPDARSAVTVRITDKAGSITSFNRKSFTTPEFLHRWVLGAEVVCADPMRVNPAAVKSHVPQPPKTVPLASCLKAPTTPSAEAPAQDLKGPDCIFGPPSVCITSTAAPPQCPFGPGSGYSPTFDNPFDRITLFGLPENVYLGSCPAVFPGDLSGSTPTAPSSLDGNGTSVSSLFGNVNRGRSSPPPGLFGHLDCNNDQDFCPWGLSAGDVPSRSLFEDSNRDWDQEVRPHSLFGILNRSREDQDLPSRGPFERSTRDQDRLSRMQSLFEDPDHTLDRHSLPIPGAFPCSIWDMDRNPHLHPVMSPRYISLADPPRRRRTQEDPFPNPDHMAHRVGESVCHLG